MPVEDKDEEEMLERSEPSTNYTVRLPNSILDRVRTLAKHRGVPLARVVKLLLKTGADDLEKKWGVPVKNN